MDRKKVLELLKEKKVQDYSFNIFFFLVFAIFVGFAIRPNLITAFSLQKELQELKLRNSALEDMILQIVDYQSKIEQYRDKLPLLDDAVPSSPTLAKAVEDVRKTASDSGLLVKSMSVESITFKDATGAGELQNFSLTFQGSATQNQINTFLNAILKQRRLKMFDSLTISNNESEISLNVIIRTYYL